MGCFIDREEKKQMIVIQQKEVRNLIVHDCFFSYEDQTHQTNYFDKFTQRNCIKDTPLNLTFKCKHTSHPLTNYIPQVKTLVGLGFKFESEETDTTEVPSCIKLLNAYPILVLRIDNIDMTADYYRDICSAVSASNCLREVEVIAKQSQSSGKALSEELILNSIGNMLERLDLSGNEEPIFSEEASSTKITAFDSFERLSLNKSLCRLSFNTIFLNEVFLAALSSALSKQKTVKWLTMKNCYITDKGLKRLSRLFLVSNLEVVNLSENKFSRKGVKFLAASMRVNKDISYLEVCNKGKLNLNSESLLFNSMLYKSKLKLCLTCKGRSECETVKKAVKTILPGKRTVRMNKCVYEREADCLVALLVKRLNSEHVVNLDYKNDLLWKIYKEEMNNPNNE
mmetsp:Transcript_35621/g.37016  ORF Transcript_35621/g.37016 Transcript_35621/m.37016 type:complete len:397 (+) Transcript_35621:17-1207(+)